MYVYCPMPIEKLSSTSQSLYYVGIGGYDRNTTYDIVCNILAQNTDGSFSNFGAFSTTGGGPGSGWTGAGLFTSTLPGLGTEALYLECVIPRSQSGWLSHVNYYEVFYQTP
jgi:hypothetical protein